MSKMWFLPNLPKKDLQSTFSFSPLTGGFLNPLHCLPANLQADPPREDGRHGSRAKLGVGGSVLTLVVVGYVVSNVIQLPLDEAQ